MFLTVCPELVLQASEADAEKLCSAGSALAHPSQHLQNVMLLEFLQRQPWREHEALGVPRLLGVVAER